MGPCNFQYFIHLTGNTRIVHRQDGLRPVRYRCLDQILINIHCIWPDIHKDRRGSPQYEGVGCGYKSIGRHNHFIPRPHIRQQCCQLRRMSTGCGQQAFSCPCPLFNPLTAFFCKFPVSADFLLFNGLTDIMQFFPRIGRYIKYDHFTPPRCY